MLDEAGRAQNQVRGQLLGEVDRLNPDYGAARAAYAGPVASRDALSRGVDAYGLHPDELGMQVTNQTPEHLGQMQLGYRGAMVDHAGRVRDSGNPWDATLGSPMARERLGTLYPDNPGVDRLTRQLDQEKQLSQTTTAVLGNSKTAQRGIADEAFLGGSAVPMMADAATMAMGGAPVSTVASRLGGQSLRDAYRLGLGKRAERKADALAPVLLGTNPAAALDQVTRYLAQQQAYRALVEATTPMRVGATFGRAIGSQTAVAPLDR